MGRTREPVIRRVEEYGMVYNGGKEHGTGIQRGGKEYRAIIHGRK